MESGQTGSAQDQSTTAAATQTKEIKVIKWRRHHRRLKPNRRNSLLIYHSKSQAGEICSTLHGDVNLKLIKCVDPVYPEVDRRAGISGNIIV
jgi:outer membrane biosynthesis protein TonB